MLCDNLLSMAVFEAYKKNTEVDDFLKGFKHINPEVEISYRRSSDEEVMKSKEKTKKKDKNKPNS